MRGAGLRGGGDVGKFRVAPSARGHAGPGRMAVIMGIVCNVQPNFSENPLPTQLKWIAFDV